MDDLNRSLLVLRLAQVVPSHAESRNLRAGFSKVPEWDRSIIRHVARRMPGTLSQFAPQIRCDLPKRASAIALLEELHLALVLLRLLQC